MLGLTVPTDDRWIDAALADLDALLVDHAHCEMKAASNALSLAVRFSDRATLVVALTALAKEELDHFQRVHAVLIARGVPFRPPSVDPYAAELRRASKIQSSKRASELVDRLLVAALIEARSCERFRILKERVGDAELRAFYEELFASEAGHYRTFLDLAIAEGARDGLDEAAVRARFEAFAVEEGRIVARLAGEIDRTTIHG